MSAAGIGLRRDQRPGQVVALRTLDALHLSIAHAIGVGGLATADQVMAEAANLLELEVVRFD